MSSPPPAGAREVFPTGGVIPAGAVGQQHQQLAISNGVLLAAVIFLFMVVVFVFLLYLYAKRYLGANPLLLPPGPGTPSSSRFVFVDASPLASRGLPAAALRALPVTVYAKPSGTGKEENEEALLECAVCLSEVADGEKVRALPKCGHGFHVDCIDMWFHSHDTCPLCRAPVAVAAEGLPRVPREEPAAAAALEFPMFPTNVLFWGTHDAVTVNTLTPHPPPPPPAPVAAASSSSSGRRKENLVIDIPARPVAVANSPLTSPLPTSSPVSARLRSLRRLLSRGKQAVVGGATSSSYSYSPRGDIEQGGGGFAGPETLRPPKTPKTPPSTS